MDMIIKKAVYRTVSVKQKKCVKQEIHGCDQCRKEIKEWPNEPSRLELTIFNKAGLDTKHEHFCSWKCVLKRLVAVDTDYFIGMPHLMFDEGVNDRSAAELKRLLKKLL